jgi:F-type H+-transporting ATPase subunit gamma
MASLRDIKRRITSVQSTQKITRAMKMVAAAKLRRAQDEITRARPYAYAMRDLVNNVAIRAESDSHPLLRTGEGGKAGIIVVTSDRGLCGGFNANIVNQTMRAIREQFSGRDVELTVVGRKGLDVLKKRPVTIRKSFINIFDESALRAAREVIDDIVADFMAGGTDEVYCIYNEFKSAVQQKVTLERLLPFEDSGAAGSGGEADESGTETAAEQTPVIDYLYEPDQEEVFEKLLVRHIQIQMHRILCESSASEHGARMTAMDAATRNAGDVIGRLTLQYNRARQDAITTELIEVISGAEAL